MGMLARKYFPAGWMPDADQTDAPPGCLLRMDNLVLDERDMLTARFGSDIIETLSDADVHSLYTQVLAGTRYRLAAAGANVYNGDTSLGVTMAGSGDVSFESYLGQIFFARSTTKKKFDGTTTRNWGLLQTGGAPTAVAVAGPAGGVIIDGDAGTDLEWQEDDGGGEEYARGYLWETADRTRAAVMVPNANTGRSVVVRRWGTDQDFDGPDTALLQIRIRVAEPIYTKSITLAISTGPDLNSDHFIATWGVSGHVFGSDIESTPGATSQPSLTVQQGTEWYLLSIPRSSMIRVGSTDGRGWDTIQAAFVIVDMEVDSTRRYGRDSMYDENLGTAGGEWDWTDPDTAPWTFNSTATAPTGETPDAYQNGPTWIDQPASSDRALASRLSAGPIYLGNKNVSWLYFNLRGALDGLRMKISMRTALSRTPPFGDPQGSDFTLAVDVANPNKYAVAWDQLDGAADPFLSTQLVAIPINTWGLPGGSSRLIEALTFSVTTPSDYFYMDRVAIRPYNANLLAEVTIGGGNSLVGSYEWVYVLVRDDGTYVTESPISAASNTLNLDQQAGEVTIPADLTRDTQTSHIWLFRRGGQLDQYYRTQVHTLSPFTTNAVVIEDATSDQAALEAGITIEEDNGPPPDNIIGIAGPYYDRIFALTADTLYPSARLQPEVFRTLQAIQIGGSDERALWVKRSFDGLYIGTTKDIYRLDGTGAEYPDGTVEFTKTPLNIDHPPISEAVAAEGNLMVYLSSSGWRAFSGAGSQALSGPTSFLYRGESRHGVSAVNLAGRFRAAIAHGQLVVITPEGASSANSTVLYRYVFEKSRWYRHTYPTAFRSIFREPDETLIAGNTASTVWELDSAAGEGDDMTDIPVEVRTPFENENSPFSPKESVGFSVHLDTGGGAASLGLYLDEATTPATTETAAAVSVLSATAFNTHRLPLWRQLQLRITGSFTRFRFSGYVVPFKALPMGVKAWDSGPMDLGQQDIVWARRVQVKCRATADLVVTPYFDGVAFPTVTIDIPASRSGEIGVFEIPVGRGFFGTIPRLVVESEEDFHPFWVEFLVRQTTEESDKPNIRIPSGLGGEAEA